jgi:hypothetical protein
MLRSLAILALLPAVMLVTPASAITAKQKMETCKVGADDQKLTGKKRDAFIKRCMAGGNYEPQARRDALKAAAKTKKANAKTKPKGAANATPTAAPAATMTPPAAAPAAEQPK